MRKKRTERAFSGIYRSEDREGVYHCAACQEPLFKSEDKYMQKNSGWPCFKRPIEPKKVYYLEDRIHSFKRYEVLCSGCHSHLGHVFNDGPPPKHFRYTINSLGLLFQKKN
jgi:peptide-methionine (R)-S-oxide reductase